ncbi:ribulokinase [Pseudogracilibacillus sp. SO10305]
MGKYAIGIDFGTGSGRVIVMNVQTGEVVATDVTEYCHGVITDRLPNGAAITKRETALQHPLDYIEVLETSIPASIQKANIEKEDIIGIGLDFTSCTILPVKEDFSPLCLDEKWESEPNAWLKLWKHHAAQEQATKINELAKVRGESWLPRYGGIISSEWMLPKVLEVLENSPEVYDATTFFVEAADWLTFQMTNSFKRNSCAAGFKGTWHEEEGYVSEDFLGALHPKLASLYKTKLGGEVASVGELAGRLTEEFAERVGLQAGIPVAMGIIDAHAGVPGAGVATPNKMVLVMGTSTCHMLLSKEEKNVPGISGVVKDSIIPNYYAYEAGQAAVGDIFAWFVKENVPAYIVEEANTRNISVHELLEEKATKLGPGANGLLALDWHNGCRTPLVDAKLSSVFIGQTLATKPEEMYRALIEATAFGTKLIIETFQKEGILIEELIACGGLPQRNKLLMQIYADVTGKPISVSASDITPAIGSAMYGAVVAGSKNGGYDCIEDACEKMVPPTQTIYTPNQVNVTKYEEIFAYYKQMVHFFGVEQKEMMEYLKQL